MKKLQDILPFASLAISVIAVMLCIAALSKASSAVNADAGLKSDIIAVNESGIKDSTAIREKLKKIEELELDLLKLHNKEREHHQDFLEWKKIQLSSR